MNEESSRLVEAVRQATQNQWQEVVQVEEKSLWQLQMRSSLGFQARMKCFMWFKAKERRAQITQTLSWTIQILAVNRWIASHTQWEKAQARPTARADILSMTRWCSRSTWMAAVSCLNCRKHLAMNTKPNIETGWLAAQAMLTSASCRWTLIRKFQTQVEAINEVLCICMARQAILTIIRLTFHKSIILNLLEACRAKFKCQTRVFQTKALRCLIKILSF